MRKSRLPAALLFGLLYVCLPASPAAFTAYMKAYVVTAGDKIPVSALVDMQPLPEASLPDIPYTPGSISLIPALLVKNLLAPFYPGVLVIIGQQTVVIPESLLSGHCQAFIYQLIKFLEPYKKSREHRLDITLPYPATLPGECTADTYTFRLAANVPAAGILAGRIAVCTTGKTPQTLPVCLDLIVDQYVPGPGEVDTAALPGHEYQKILITAREVKAGDAVTIHFQKGNIRLKMDGLAYASGSLGDTVSVKPSTTNKRFPAVVTGEREVSIELP